MTKMFFSVICTTLVTILIIMSMAMNAKKHRFGGGASQSVMVIHWDGNCL